MAVQYQLAPIPKWQFTDNRSLPLVKGRIYTYSNLRRQEYKPVFQDPGGLVPYPAPFVELDGTGAIGPIYWMTDENYYVVITDSTGTNVIYTVEDYHPESGSSSPVTISVDLKNHFLNPQFLEHYQEFWTQDTISTSQGIGNAWAFRVNNRTATDSIKIVKILPGSLPLTIEGCPEYYFEYTCSVAGAGETEKDLYQNIDAANTFENQNITISFVGQSTIFSTVEVYMEVNYGTGGSPTDTYLIDTIHLTDNFVKHFCTTFPVPSLIGKTIGNAGDDSINIFIRFPLDSIANVKVTNMQINVGDRQLPFTYITPKENEINCRAIKLQKPSSDNWVDKYFSYTVPSWGEDAPRYNMELTAVPPVGFGGMWFIEVIPSGYIAMAGQAESAYDFRRLYDVLGLRYGSNNDNGNGNIYAQTGATISFENFGNGAISEAWNAGTTGFTINVVQNGDATHNHKVNIICTSAASLSGGEYLTFSMPNGQKWAIWFRVGNNGTKPTVSGHAVPGRAVHLNTWDDATAVATALKLALDPLIFYLPDTRGYFLRSADGYFTSSGYAGGYTGRDPDMAGRTARPDGASGLAAVGTTQGDENKSHLHSINQPPHAGITAGTTGFTIAQADASVGPSITMNPDGGAEARPKNFDFVTIIKF